MNRFGAIAPLVLYVFLAGMQVLVPERAWAQASQAQATQDASLRRVWIEWPRLGVASHSQLQWALFAHLGAGAEGASQDGSSASSFGRTALGAELRIATPRCELFAVGGQAHVWRWPGDNALGAEQWARTCVSIDERLFNIHLSHHLEWEVTPALSASPYFHADKNRRETVRKCRSVRDGSGAPEHDIVTDLRALAGCEHRAPQT